MSTEEDDLLKTLRRMINKKLVNYDYALDRIWNTANLWKWKPKASAYLVLRLIQLGTDYKDLEFEPKHRYAKKLMAEKGCTKCFNKKKFTVFPKKHILIKDIRHELYKYVNY